MGNTRAALHRLSQLTLLVIIVCGSADCGRKTNLRPPELVLPQAVPKFTVSPGPAGIELQWTRPSKYIDGTPMRDLAAFRIERSIDGSRWNPVTTLFVGDQNRFRQIRNFRYLDANKSKGEIPLYRIRAIASDGAESASTPGAVGDRTEPPQ